MENAVKRCGHCGEDFHTAEDVCPKCGAPLRENGQAEAPSTEETVAMLGVPGLL